MVVLSTAICTKSGKALLTRQYVDMSRVRVEGLLAAFPKLLAAESKSEHTYIETESVRYVYHPLEGLYLLLVTNKGSNIIEDLGTLSLLSKVVPDVCGPVSVDAIKHSAYNLVFAFDEVISYGGYREPITLQQIRTNMEMESHEEKLAILIRISKMNEAKEEAKRKATAMRMARKQMGATGTDAGPHGLGPMAGMGGGSSYGGSGSGSLGGSGTGSGRYGGASPRDRGTGGSSSAGMGGAGGKPKRKMGKGMGLKKKGTDGGARGGDAMTALLREEGMDLGGASAAAEAEHATGGAVAALTAASDVEVRAEERLSVVMTRDGGCKSMEVKGILQLQAHSDEASRVRVLLERGDLADFKFQSHPNISKPLWNGEGILELKDASRGFPVNADVGVLRWRSSTKDASKVPLIINCWPEELGGEINVNIEYVLQRTDLELLDVAIAVPLPSADAPSVISCDGQHKHDPRSQTVTWTIDLVDAGNDSGTFEFTIPGEDVDAFFPVMLNFRSSRTLCPVTVSEVQHVDSGAPVSFAATTSSVIDSYTVTGE